MKICRGFDYLTGLKTNKNMRVIIVLIFLIIPHVSNSQESPNIDKLDDSVVLIKIYDYSDTYSGHGSGFIINESGDVLTNYHVVEDAFKLEVVRERNGVRETFIVDRILKGDESIDLAIISLKNIGNRRFYPLKISNLSPKKGDECWAIGTPADEIFMNTVSKGLISNFLNTSGVNKIVTNAEIAPGSSGGPLINNNGEVIGVTSSGWDTEAGARASLNFAIDIREINNLNEINKRQIIDPKSIPCEISFYTNSSLGANAQLYINRNYIGSFSKYFRSGEPECGDEGTITRTLSSGRHYYFVYYSHTKEYSPQYYIDLEPGDCHKVNVLVNSPKKHVPIRRNEEVRANALYAVLANSTPYSANAFDGRIFSLGLEQKLNKKIFLRVKIQSPKEYISDVDYYNGSSLPWDEQYSCSYNYQAVFVDLKVFDNSFENTFSRNAMEEPGGPWWAPSLSFVRLKKERVSGIDAPMLYPNQTSIGIGGLVGYDWHFAKKYMFTSEILWMKYFNKDILDESRYYPTTISPQASSFCLSISLAYRFNTLF